GTGKASSGGDGGPATSAGLNNPTGVALDPAGNLYIADQNNQRIRKVTFGSSSALQSVRPVAGTASGTISTVTGSGQIGTSCTSSSLSNARYYNPINLAVIQEILYVADYDAYLVCAADLTGGTVTVTAGTGVTGYAVDGTTPPTN